MACVEARISLRRKPFVPKAIGRSGQVSLFCSFFVEDGQSLLPCCAVASHRPHLCSRLRASTGLHGCAAKCVQQIMAKDVTGTAPMQVVNEAFASFCPRRLETCCGSQVLRPFGTGAFHAAVEVHGRPGALQVPRPPCRQSSPKAI